MNEWLLWVRTANAIRLQADQIKILTGRQGEVSTAEKPAQGK